MTQESILAGKEGMEHDIPAKLKQEPLIEALWEVRFTSSRPSIAELLPGIVFHAMPNQYPNIVRLPAADIPTPIAERDPSLRYIPKIRLEGGNRAIQIGEHVIPIPRKTRKTWESGLRGGDHRL